MESKGTGEKEKGKRGEVEDLWNSIQLLGREGGIKHF